MKRKAGLAPRFSVFSCKLPPVAFYQDPATVPLFPVMSHPHGTGPRRMSPIATDPNIAVAIPAVVAVDPDPSGMRWMFVDFNDRRGRRHANNNLRH